jgi:putative N6-adenine-specific DNA methylase
VDVRATCRKSKIYHSEAAAERVAKGIADRLKLSTLPTFGEGAPDEAGGNTSVMVRLDRDHCTVSLDTSGAHLHRRGYRLHAGAAPLRETLAAAMLMMSGWSPDKEGLIDPMCGSGTLPIEAALLAARIPPGILRTFAFETAPFYDRSVFEETRDRVRRGIRAAACPIFASDIDETAVGNTIANATRAGVAPYIETARRDAAELQGTEENCLVICNPPYGKRVGERRNLRDLYHTLGERLLQMKSARLAMVTADPTFAAAVGVPFVSVSTPFPNGGIRVRLYMT